MSLEQNEQEAGMPTLKVLIVGSGGRESALAWMLKKRPGVDVFAAPGNAGIHRIAQCVPIPENDFDALSAFAKDRNVDLTIVGPEAPLVGGIVDVFTKEGCRILGPSKHAAQAEGSKIWFKDFLARNRLPTSPFVACTSVDDAIEYIGRVSVEKFVFKLDGLADGKGVFLPNTKEETEGIFRMIRQHGGPFLIEKRLSGSELSVIGITDGRDVRMFPLSRDYKRLTGNLGSPNTGGMGAHTLPLFTELSEKCESLMRQVIAALAHEGISYRGVIYLGFMEDKYGDLQILECNVRFGDPEAQAVLPSIGLSSREFAELAIAAADGNLGSAPSISKTAEALSVTLASEKYPRPSDRDDLIQGISDAEQSGALIFHGHTGLFDGRGATTNCQGRVVYATGVAPRLGQARKIAYAGATKIQFPGVQYRSDIGGMYR